MSEVIQTEALTNLLDQKGIISKQELLEEIKRVVAKMPRAGVDWLVSSYPFSN